MAIQRVLYFPVWTRRGEASAHINERRKDDEDVEAVVHRFQREDRYCFSRIFRLTSLFLRGTILSLLFSAVLLLVRVFVLPLELFELLYTVSRLFI